MAKRQTPNKQDLVKELERIRDSLLADSGGIVHSPPSNSAPPDNHHNPPPERQQSLFDEPEPNGKHTTLKPAPSSIPENPFLPNHIRQRLQSNRTQLMQELAAISSQANSRQPAKSKNIDARVEQLVDEIVSSKIESIEQELRERLRILIKDSMETVDH